MIEYPKIETLYDRDPKTFKVIPTKLRLPEFDLPKRWLITEKIDGTNIRVNFNGKSVLIGGRTDNAQLPPALLKMLMSKFTPELFHQAFPDDTATDVTLYGEGYGARIQKSGGIYRPDPGFRLFDVRIGDWWLNWQNVEEVATALGISTVPVIYYEYDIDNLPDSHESLAWLMKGTATAIAEQEGGTGGQAEGIVARTDPLLTMRNGSRLMWKLKYKDF